MKTIHGMSSTIAVTALLLTFSLSAPAADAGPFTRFTKAAKQQRRDRAKADKALHRLSAGKLGKPIAKLRSAGRRAQAGWWAVKTSPVMTFLAVGGTGVAATDAADTRVRVGAGIAAAVGVGARYVINRRAKRRMVRQGNVETAGRLLNDPEYKGHLSTGDEQTLERGYQIAKKPAASAASH